MEVTLILTYSLTFFFIKSQSTCNQCMNVLFNWPNILRDPLSYMFLINKLVL